MLLDTIPGVRYVQTKLNQLTSYIPPPLPSSADTEKNRPKNVLIVHAHPSPRSFSACIAETLEQSAVAVGHHVQRISLYPHRDPLQCYRPNLSCSEREHYFDGAYNNDDDNTNSLAPDVRSHLDLLKWCNVVVFIYPTWWMNTPASLKGFFDRTLLPGHAWELPSSNNSVASLGLAPKLENITQIVGISTYGASHHVVTIAGDNGRRMISNGIRHSIAPKATVRWLGLYDCDSLQEEQYKSFLDEVKELSTIL